MIMMMTIYPLRCLRAPFFPVPRIKVWISYYPYDGTNNFVIKFKYEARVRASVFPLILISCTHSYVNWNECTWVAEEYSYVDGELLK